MTKDFAPTETTSTQVNPEKAALEQATVRFETIPPQPRGTDTALDDATSGVVKPASWGRGLLSELQAGLRDGANSLVNTLRQVNIVGAIIAVIAAVVLLQIPDDVASSARLTLWTFTIAVWLWIFSSLDDTFVALGAATVLVLGNIIPVDGLFMALGDEQTWLLIGAFIVAATVTSTGLATKAVVYLCSGRITPRGLAHTLSLAAVASAYAIPATSGRAALLLPLFLALAPVTTAWFSKLLSLLLPVVVLLSAVGALIGAGAHLITVQILEESNYDGFTFTSWLMLGMPYALACSVIATEVILYLFTTSEQRKEVFTIDAAELDPGWREPLTKTQARVLLLLTITIVFWATESLHGIHPALVSIIAALICVSPWVGKLDLGTSIKKVPWNMIMFMAATLALSSALAVSGAAEFLAQRVFSPLTGSSSGSSASGAAGTETSGGWLSSGLIFVVAIVAFSMVAHLFIQSRSGRSAALIPIIVAVSPAFGVNPVAAAFISTAAAGFCHSLPTSARPLKIFSGVRAEGEEVEVFTQADLTKFALVYSPIFLVLTVFFAVVVWPAQGLELYLPAP